MGGVAAGPSRSAGFATLRTLGWGFRDGQHLDSIRYEVCYPLVPKWKCSKCKSLGGVEISEGDGTQYVLCMQDGCQFTEDTAGIVASSKQHSTSSSSEHKADKDRLESVAEEKSMGQE